MTSSLNFRHEIVISQHGTMCHWFVLYPMALVAALATGVE